MNHTEVEMGMKPMATMIQDVIAALGIEPEVPEGRGFTVRELQKDTGLSYSATLAQVRQALEAGKVRKIGKRRDVGSPTTVYELVDGKPKKSRST